MTSSVFRKAALIAAVCTLVQAVVWFALSLVGLLAAVHVITVSVDETMSPASVTGQGLLSCYFPEKEDDDYDDESCCDKLIMPNDGMLGTSIVYLIISLVWVGFSAMLIEDLTNGKKRVPTLTLAWAVVTIVVCSLDFVVTILFGVDYGIMSTAKDENDDKYLCVGNEMVYPGLLMSLAARGYVLWLLNLISAIWLIKAAKSVNISRRGSRASSADSYYNDPVDAVAQESRSMVFHGGGVNRTWAGTDPRSVSQPPLDAWNQPDMRTPGMSSQRGGLAQRMQQTPPAQSPGYRPPSRGPMTPTSPPPRPPSHAPMQSPSRYPDPDYDPRGGAGREPRSVLKKPPPPAVPAPGLGPASPSNIENWRLQVQQADNRFQRPGGNQSYYDNRGYDGGRTGF